MNINTIKKPTLLLFLLLVQTLGLTQTILLDSLIEEATQKLPLLQQKQAELQIAKAQLAEAERGFYPNANFGTSYTVAYGGRTISFPADQLLNPVYSTLNQLTGSEQFPQLEAAEVQLFPNNFYDARFRVQQPILQPEIKQSQKLAQLGIDNANAVIEVTRDEVKHAVRSAYYQLVQATIAEDIYSEAILMINEALRTTKALIKNDAALPIARERMVAEKANILAQQATAKSQTKNALAQLNFWLNRPLDQPFPLDVEKIELVDLAVLNQEERAIQINNRPELKQLNTKIQSTILQSELEDQFHKPRLGLQLDLGSQAFDFGFQPYVLAGINLDIPLYDGQRHNKRKDRLAAERLAAEAQRKQIENSFSLQAQVAWQNYESAKTELAAYDKAINASKRTLKDATILYKNGLSGYVELLDARTQVTNIQLQKNIAAMMVQLRLVDYLRAIGS